MSSNREDGPPSAQGSSANPSFAEEHVPETPQLLGRPRQPQQRSETGALRFNPVFSQGDAVAGSVQMDEGQDILDFDEEEAEVTRSPLEDQMAQVLAQLTSAQAEIAALKDQVEAKTVSAQGTADNSSRRTTAFSTPPKVTIFPQSMHLRLDKVPDRRLAFKNWRAQASLMWEDGGRAAVRGALLSFSQQDQMLMSFVQELDGKVPDTLDELFELIHERFIAVAGSSSARARYDNLKLVSDLANFNVFTADFRTVFAEAFNTPLSDDSRNIQALDRFVELIRSNERLHENFIKDLLLFLRTSSVTIEHRREPWRHLNWSQLAAIAQNAAQLTSLLPDTQKKRVLNATFQGKVGKAPARTREEFNAEIQRSEEPVLYIDAPAGRPLSTEAFKQIRAVNGCSRCGGYRTSGLPPHPYDPGNRLYGCPDPNKHPAPAGSPSASARRPRPSQSPRTSPAMPRRSGPRPQSVTPTGAAPAGPPPGAPPAGYAWTWSLTPAATPTDETQPDL